MVERKHAAYLWKGQIDAAGGAKMAREDLCMPRCELRQEAVGTSKSCVCSEKNLWKLLLQAGSTWVGLDISLSSW